MVSREITINFYGVKVDHLIYSYCSETFLLEITYCLVPTKCMHSVFHSDLNKTGPKG